MLLDYQSGNSHNSTTRIYEKTAARVSRIGLDITSTERQASLGPISNAANIGGQHELIYQVGNPQLGLGGVAAFAANAANYSTVATSPVDSNILNFNSDNANPGNYTDAGQNFNYTDFGAIWCGIGIKLVSGNLKNSRYLPLLALKGSGLTLEITLADHRTAFCNTAAAALTANPAAGGGGGIPPHAHAATGADTIAAGTLTSYSVRNVEYIGSTIGTSRSVYILIIYTSHLF